MAIESMVRRADIALRRRVFTLHEAELRCEMRRRGRRSDLTGAQGLDFYY